MVEAAEIARSGGSDPREEWNDRHLVGNIVRRLERFVNAKLDLYVGSRTRTIVMEKFLGSACIRLHLPDYYPPPTKAHAQQRIIQNLKGSLDLIKGMQSSEMLAYRGTLLNAATTSDAQGDGLAMSRILKIRPEILSSAVERRASVEASGGSQFAVHKRKGRSDALTQDVVAKVLSWWESETRVSPNRKDTVATQDRVFPHYVPNSSIKHSKSDSKDRSQEIL
jgi:hypothetical protein